MASSGDADMARVVGVQVSQHDIVDVTHTLGVDEFDDVYIELGLDKNDVEKARAGIRNDNVNLREKEVFHKWLQINGSEATRKKILDALKKCNFKKSLQALLKKWNIQGFQIQEPSTARDESLQSPSDQKKYIGNQPSPGFLPKVSAIVLIALVIVVIAATVPKFSKNTLPDVPSTLWSTTSGTPIGDTDIKVIASDLKLKRDQLHMLYKELGLSSDIVEDAEETTRAKALNLRAIGVLEKWRQINGEGATRDKILDALKRAELNYALGILKTKWES